MRGFFKIFFVICSLFIIPPASAVGMGDLCDATNKCDANLFCDNATSKCASCSTATSSKYPKSIAGSSDITACYQDCRTITITLGEQRPDSSKVYHPSGACSYTVYCTAANSEKNSDGTGCQCKSHYTQSGNTSCTGEVHKITLRKNQTWGDIDKSVWVKYGTGFADKQNPSDWRATPDIVPTLWWHHEFAGYYDQQEGGNQKITSTGKLPSGIKNTSFADITELWGHWDPKPYTVRYYKDETSTSSVHTQSCKFDDDCIAWTPSPNEKKSIVLSGQEFDSQWKYKSGSTKISVGSKITQPTSEEDLKNGIDLIAVYKPCDAGYYCDTSKQECPAGATSPQGSSEKKQCYISGTTMFQDNNGSFKLPIGNLNAN